MRQILGIIQAFSHNPALVILDEPTTGLDPLNQEKFYAMISRERGAGTTIFFSSHVLSEVQQVCDRVAMVRDGRLVMLQDADQYLATVGKCIQITSSGGVKQVSDALMNLTGIHRLLVRNDMVEFHFTGTIDDLLKRMVTVPIDDLICVNPQIEDVFFDLYRE
jgi:ABC-2 type transport system ATP-binding protein